MRSGAAPDRTELEHVVAGLSEGVILVEPDQSISYANEAALAMHGVASLDQLGRNVDEYRNNFVLRYRNDRAVDKGQYPVDRVIAGEAFDDVVVVVAHKKDPDRDWTHRIRSLIVSDAHGAPACLVLIIHDTSAEVEAEERFERTFGANPAPAVICRLSDLRFIKLNEGFRELTGYKREDVLGRTIYQLDLLERAERRELALGRLHAGETIPQMEACISVPSDPAGHLVILAGQPIEIGAEPCMLFTFADLEPRRKAQTALRHSEERFAKAFRLAPVPMSITTADDHRFIEVNQAFKQSIGYDVETVVGQDADRLGLWMDESAKRQFDAELIKKGVVRSFEAVLRGKDGTELTCLVSAETVTLGDRCCVLSALQDISTRKRSEEELVKAIEAVMADASWFSRGVVEKLAALRQPPRPGQGKAAVDGIADLTTREREILGLVCQGQSDDEIGSALQVARNTVRNHLAALYRKVGVNRRSALIIWARERGIRGDDIATKRKPPRKIVQNN